MEKDCACLLEWVRVCVCVCKGERDWESERAMEGDVEMAAAVAEEDGAAVVCDIRFLSLTLYFRVN